MARHIMAVCVVCLLCADQMPCEQHIEDDSIRAGAGAGTVAAAAAAAATVYPSDKIEYQALNAKVFRTRANDDDYSKIIIDDRPFNTENSINIEQKQSPKQQQPEQRHHQSNIKNNNHYHSLNNLNGNQPMALLRRRRHAGHTDDHLSANHRPEITQNFLQRLFDENGQGDGTLTIDEFRNILTQLGLHRLVQEKLIVNDSQNNNNTDNCIADANLVQRVQKMNFHEHSSDHDHFDHYDEHLKNCSSGENVNVSTSTFCRNSILGYDNNNESSQNYTLNKDDIVNLCPVLLYQLSSASDIVREGCIENDILVDIDERSHKKFHAGKEDIVYVWTYAFISVFACGILGLVGVAIIPFMDSRYYKHIIQYLVSLAVGTMTGDALLHLLPHSLAGQSESGMIYKGLTCMGGIIFFYITEHGLTMISEWRKSKAKKDKNQSRAKVVRDPDSSITNSVAGDKLCKSKYSSYPYCYDEIAMDTKNDVWMHLPNNTTENCDLSIVATGNDRKRNGRAEANANESMAAQSLLSTSQTNYAPMIMDMNNHHQHPQHQHPQHQHKNLHHLQHHDHQQQQQQQTTGDHHSLGDGNINLIGNASGNGANNSGGGGGGAITTTAGTNISINAKDNKHSNDTVTVILREHESSHHGHSHKHGHVHSPPESLSAVAWMIIMGDGLHNFTDGMAIGAAFAENIAGGFSTSLAVFCHELPHELGDFAILMKAGMSVKSAVYYNLLTGVLSFIGMIFGIVFGQSQAAAQWMFAAAAGLFIYIALVDMMPELSAAHKSLEQLALQIFGMSTGVFLMLLIAIYEGDLMNIFSSSSLTSSASSLSSTTTTIATGT